MPGNSTFYFHGMDSGPYRVWGLYFGPYVEYDQVEEGEGFFLR
jgi:hypothetical protein